MSHHIIPRDEVHTISEGCAERSSRFAVLAPRLAKEQRHLTRFIKREASSIEGQEAQVAVYLYTVILRVFQASGARLSRVREEEISAARERLKAWVPTVLPLDDDFPERVRGIAERAQPHILDEALWALFEREELEEGEIPVEKGPAGRIFLLLWIATEVLDQAWR